VSHLQTGPACVLLGDHFQKKTIAKFLITEPERRSSVSYWAIASLVLIFLLGAINLVGYGRAFSQDDPRTFPPLVEIAIVRLPEASRRAFSGVVVARVQKQSGFPRRRQKSRAHSEHQDFVRHGQPLMDRNDLALAIAARNAAVASAQARDSDCQR
jgi:hypothetical protein